MTVISEGAFRIENGVEYNMEFTPQSRWDCEISAKYRDGARGVLRLNIRFEATETSLDISLSGSKGEKVTPDGIRADGCSCEDILGGVRFCGLHGIPRIKGELSCVVAQGTYYVGFGHGMRAGADGSGEMVFSVSVLR